MISLQIPSQKIPLALHIRHAGRRCTNSKPLAPPRSSSIRSIQRFYSSTWKKVKAPSRWACVFLSSYSPLASVYVTRWDSKWLSGGGSYVFHAYMRSGTFCQEFLAASHDSKISNMCNTRLHLCYPAAQNVESTLCRVETHKKEPLRRVITDTETILLFFLLCKASQMQSLMSATL